MREMTINAMEYLRPPARQSGIAPQTKLPAVKSADAIKEAVDAYFTNHSEKIARSIQTKMDEVQVKILDGLCRTIQARYVKRIESLEANTSRNSDTLREIRGHSERADEDLRRLAAGISGLLEQTSKSESE